MVCTKENQGAAVCAWGISMNIDHLVLRRIEQWEQQHKMAEAAGQIRQKPTITISRSFGGRGRAIGELVAKELGLNLYDREIVEQIAERAQVRQKVVESLDDRLVNRIGNWVGEQFETGYFTYSQYLDHLSRVLLTVAAQESAVIVGRGANFILLPDRTLRVRADAPFDMRVARIAASHQLSERDARAKVLQKDAERLAFGRRHFAKDLSLAEHYDLVLNSAVFSEPDCARLVIDAFRRRFP
jgi:hypothetical protein